MSKSIISKNYLNVREEYVATAVAITPGTLLELTSAGLVQAHSGAGLNALQMFAIEDELQGKGIDENYAASDRVQAWIPQRGDVVEAIIADGQNVSIGDFLESNGDGTLRVHSLDSTGIYYTNAIVGQALEAVDLSGSSGEESSTGVLGYDRRIKVRIV